MTRSLATLLAAAAMLLPACEQESDNMIGPRGGEVVSEDGRVSISIPAGALDHTVEIEIQETLVAPGNMLGNSYLVGPTGTSFAIPATVTYELEPDQMGAEGLAWSSQRDGEWFPMPDCDVNHEDMTLTASALYLSQFAVIAD
jgi:hypothetical protein